jgi:hypothetical protein
VGLTATATALAMAGCGSGDSHPNEPRPPAAITITGRIDERSIELSPASFGAGPVTILLSNQSGRPQELTFETDEVAGTSAGIRRSSEPIAPRGTGELKVDPREGTYRLSAKDGAIAAAAVRVGPPRPTSQGELLLP